MKNASEKYDEAVDRNVHLAERILKATPDKAKYSGFTLNEAKHRMGIKLSDERYDERIKKLIVKKAA